MNSNVDLNLTNTNEERECFAATANKLLWNNKTKIYETVQQDLCQLFCIHILLFYFILCLLCIIFVYQSTSRPTKSVSHWYRADQGKRETKRVLFLKAQDIVFKATTLQKEGKGGKQW